MLNMPLYLAQRLSAMVMAPLVLVHLGVMVYAVQGGLDAAEILGRTQGSVVWGATYGLFVVAVAIHAAIGVRVVLHEWAKIQGIWLDLLTAMIAFTLLWMGGRAVYAVILA